MTGFFFFCLDSIHSEKVVAKLLVSFEPVQKYISVPAKLPTLDPFRLHFWTLPNHQSSSLATKSLLGHFKVGEKLQPEGSITYSRNTIHSEMCTPSENLI